MLWQQESVPGCHAGFRLSSLRLVGRRRWLTVAYAARPPVDHRATLILLGVRQWQWSVLDWIRRAQSSAETDHRRHTSPLAPGTTLDLRACNRPTGSPKLSSGHCGWELRRTPDPSGRDRCPID